MKKSYYVIAAIGLVIFIGAICLLYEKGVTKKSENLDSKNMDASTKCDESSEENSENDEDKRFVTLPLEANLEDESTYYKLSNEKLAWWIKRGEDHAQSCADNTVKLSLYDACFLDEKVTDDDKIIYMTFDCGYDNGYTEKMLDVLAKEDVPACFFVTQTYIRDNIDIVKRMKSEGHQVGNHSISHPDMTNISFDEIVHELEGCSTYMETATGYRMDPYFRPPKGEYSERLLAIAQDMGYKTIFWSMAYLDYDVNKQPGADYVIKHFEKYHHNGAIVLMHNVSSSNAEALETVIKMLKEEGYRFESLNNMEF